MAAFANAYRNKKGLAKSNSYVCKECYAKERREGWAHLKQYGITIDDYNRLFIAQEGRCVICHEPSDKRLFVDHNHQTGQVRGLLCRQCNTHLGQLERDRSWAQAAEAYLRSHESVHRSTAITVN